MSGAGSNSPPFLPWPSTRRMLLGREAFTDFSQKTDHRDYELSKPDPVKVLLGLMIVYVFAIALTQIAVDTPAGIAYFSTLPQARLLSHRLAIQL